MWRIMAGRTVIAGTFLAATLVATANAETISSCITATGDLYNATIGEVTSEPCASGDIEIQWNISTAPEVAADPVEPDPIPVVEDDPVETDTDPIEVADSSACVRETEYFPEDFARVLEDFDQTKTLRLDGPDWDNTLIRNCRIHDTGGNGIYIRDVRNVVITGCEVFDIGGNGIHISSRGSTANVTLDENYIHDIDKNGIHAAQRSAIE